MKWRNSFAIMFCVLSPLSCAKATACYPSLKTTTTRGLKVGFFVLSHMSLNHYPVLLSVADILSSSPAKVSAYLPFEDSESQPLV